MSADVLLSTLKGHPLPDGWVFVGDGKVGAFMTTEVRCALADHPAVTYYEAQQKEKQRIYRSRKISIRNAPKAWGIG